MDDAKMGMGACVLADSFVFQRHLSTWIRGSAAGHWEGGEVMVRPNFRNEGKHNDASDAHLDDARINIRRERIGGHGTGQGGAYWGGGLAAFSVVAQRLRLTHAF